MLTVGRSINRGMEPFVWINHGEKKAYQNPLDVMKMADDDPSSLLKRKHIDQEEDRDYDAEDLTQDLSILQGRRSKIFKKVKAIQFGVYDSNEIMKAGVLEVKIPDVQEGGKIKTGSVNDLRFGTCQTSADCSTCGKDVKNCPGHFGYINLKKPVFNILFVGHVVDILKCVCYHCSKVMLSRSSPHWKKIENIEKANDRFKALKEIITKNKDVTKMRYCGSPTRDKGFSDGCGQIQPIYKDEEKLKIVAQFPLILPGEDSQHKKLTAEDVLKIFRKIRPEDYKILGFDGINVTPEALIMRRLPVPPVPIRPTNMTNNISKREDDMTQKLLSLVKDNLSLEQKIKTKPKESWMKDLMAFQMSAGEYFDADPLAKKMMVVTNPQKMAKNKGTMQRLLGKTGRFRGNLMGKRFTECARTVITPDDLIKLDEVGVPESMTKTLTYPEVVTPLNILRLTKKVLNGPEELDGANSVELADGETFLLGARQKRKVLPLKFGSTVYRHLEEGDDFIMNRQPSLHKVSILGHKVKILPGNTFRINTSVCTPYNADFDGDEMNGNAQRKPETRAEAQEIMAVQKNIINSQNSSPIIGLVQNTLTGSHIMSFRDTMLDFEQVTQILMFTSSWNGTLPIPCILRPKKLWSGKQIIQYCLPKDIYYKGPSLCHSEKYDSYRLESVKHIGPHEDCIKMKPQYLCDLQKVKFGFDDPKLLDQYSHLFKLEIESVKAPFFSINDSYVTIEDGTFLAGKLCKNSVGTKHQSLIHILVVDYGDEKNKQFIEDMQSTVGSFLDMRGISMGIKDMEHDKQDFRRLIQLKIGEVEKRLKKWKDDGITPKEYEDTINRALNAARNDIAEGSMNVLSPYNNLKNMVESGAKGSNVNVSQITRLGGQTNVSGKRIGNQIFGRVSSYHKKGEDSIAAGGFISSNFRDGLGPYEMVVCAMAAREGMVDTAVKTSETGYSQRRLGKATEDVNVKYDGTVRNLINQVVQFQYGEDNFDNSHSEKQYLPWKSMSDEKFEQDYCWKGFMISRDGLSVRDGKKREIDREYNSLEYHPVIQREWNRLKQDRKMQWVKEMMYCPCNFARLIEKSIKRKPAGWKSDISPIQMVKDVYVLQKKIWEMAPNLTETWNSKIAIMIRAYLSSKRATCVYKVSKAEWVSLLRTILNKIQRSFIQPGESVGILAAQAIGELLTQMTLKTFHAAGDSSKNITLGVPRFKEIVNCSKRTKTPSMTIHILPPFCKNESLVKFIAKNMVFVSLGDIIIEPKYQYSPYAPPWHYKDFLSINVEDIWKNVKSSTEQVQTIFDFIPDILPTKEITYSNFCCQLILNGTKLREKSVSLSKIAKNIFQRYGNAVLVKYNDEFCSPCILELRLSSDYGSDQESLRDLVHSLSESIQISGVQNIKETFIRKKAEEWIIDTEGTNWKEVSAIPFVDRKRSITNDINEIYQNFGIEATRNAIINEIYTVLNNFNCFINSRHLTLLADVICFNGKTMGITRHGINRIDTGPLIKASFEETKEIITDAARFGERDDIKGATGNVMLGSIPRMGTGAIDVFLDTSKLIHAKPIIFEPNEEYKELMKKISQEEKQAAENPHLMKQTDYFLNFGGGGEDD